MKNRNPVLLTNKVKPENKPKWQWEIKQGSQVGVWKLIKKKNSKT